MPARPAIEDAPTHKVPRAPVSLEVAFSTSSDLGRALACGIEPAGIAFATAWHLPVGSAVSLTLKATAVATLTVAGEVVACSPTSVGIRFPSLSAPDGAHLEELARASSSAKAGKPAAAHVSGVRSAVLWLSDEMLTDVTAELLGLKGVAVFDGPPEGITPDVIAASTTHLATAARIYPGVPLVAVNLSADALAGSSTAIKPNVYVKKPASATALMHAVVGLFRHA